jgi:hypothetical protein
MRFGNAPSSILETKIAAAQSAGTPNCWIAEEQA